MSAAGRSRGALCLYTLPLKGRLKAFQEEEQLGFLLLHFGNYPSAALFHTEWLFGIKGAIEPVSQISLRFLTSLTNVLLLPWQRGIYLPVRNTLCFRSVWNPLLLLKTHPWNEMNASDRHFPRGNMGLHPARMGPGLTQHRLVGGMQAWPWLLEE